MDNNAEIITIKGLIKHFPIGGGWFTALNGIDLTFGRGEFAGFVGPSGSGKTTLLNIIGSLDVPSEGQVSVLGRSIGRLSHKEAASLRTGHLGFIFQTHNLLPVYTVFENVELPLLLLDMPSRKRREAVLEMIESVGLTPKLNSRPAQLSGGECQRVAIARAMVKVPEIVLADEPTANLDAENSYHILQIMESLNSRFKTTFIFASHDEKVIRYLRRIITLIDGKVTDDRAVGEAPSPRQGTATC